MTTTPILWRADQQANTTDTGAPGDDQTGIRLVGLANGNFVALWESNTDGGPDGGQLGTDIIGQLYDPEGNAIGGEFRANDGFFVDDEGVFEAAALPNGNFVLVFEDTDVDGTSLRFNVRDATGAVVSTGTIRADPGANDVGDPSVTVNADGSFMVAYQEINAGANQTQTLAVIVDSAGTVGAPISMAGAATSTNVGTQEVDVATLTNGNYVVVSRDTGADNGMSMRIITSTGVNVLALTAVSNTLTNGENDSAATVTALTGGGFVVAWQNTDAVDTDLEFQIFNAAGGLVGGVGTVNDGGATDNNRTPELIGLSDGGFVVVYDDNEAGTIALQRFDAAGALVGAEQVVATDGFVSNGTPSVTLSDDGRLLVGWGTSVFTGGINFDNDVRFAVWDPREVVITGDGTSEVITAFADGGTVNGGNGNDTIFGVDAADVLRGESGSDTIRGRGGDDLIEGGFDDDTIFGDDGNDTIFAMTQGDADGSEIADIISGGAGFDTITGSGGDDTINGDEDDDTLDGGFGGDKLNGGTGFDTFVYNTGEAVLGEIIDGGADFDTVRVQTEPASSM